jgi:hypothetical protein
MNNKFEAVIIDDSFVVREEFSKVLENIGFSKITAYPCVTRGALVHLGINTKDLKLLEGNRKREDIYNLQIEFAEEYNEGGYENTKFNIEEHKSNLVLFLDRELANGLHNLKDTYLPLNGDKFLKNFLNSGGKITVVGISKALKAFNGIESEHLLGNTEVKATRSIDLMSIEISKILAQNGIEIKTEKFKQK